MKRFPDGIQGAGETGKGGAGGGQGLLHLQRKGRVQGHPCSRQLGGGGVMCRKELCPDVAQRFLLPQALGVKG